MSTFEFSSNMLSDTIDRVCRDSQSGNAFRQGLASLACLHDLDTGESRIPDVFRDIDDEFSELEECDKDFPTISQKLEYLEEVKRLFNKLQRRIGKVLAIYLRANLIVRVGEENEQKRPFGVGEPTWYQKNGMEFDETRHFIDSLNLLLATIDSKHNIASKKVEETRKLINRINSTNPPI